jgi:hypothetical protein
MRFFEKFGVSLILASLASLSPVRVASETKPASAVANPEGRSSAHQVMPLPISQNSKRRNWWENPGRDGSFWVSPFYRGANWIRTGPLVSALRNGKFDKPTGTVNVKGNFAAPWVVGTSTDPLVTVTDGKKSIRVHVPRGTMVETPTSAFDQSIGGADRTQPYLVWSISGATIDTGTVRSGSTIRGTFAFQIDDGSGLIMCDAETGQPGGNNSIGGIQDLELSALKANPNYIIPHMLAFATDPSQVNNDIVWPLKDLDTSGVNSGLIPQGVTIGIPADVPRPIGRTRGFYALFDNLQKYGWFYYNVAGAGSVVISVYSNESTNASLVNDISRSMSEVMSYVDILNYRHGVAGAQYSLDTVKGKTVGAALAFTDTSRLDLSPTGNKTIPPARFGAYYPSDYGRPLTNASTRGVEPQSSKTPY